MWKEWAVCTSVPLVLCVGRCGQPDSTADENVFHKREVFVRTDWVDAQQKGSRQEENCVSLFIIETQAAVSKEGPNKTTEEGWRYFLLIRPREFKTTATEQIHERIPEEEIG